MRSNPDIVASNHIVFIANSATYDIPVMENVKYTGNTLDQLTNLIKVTDWHTDIETMQRRRDRQKKNVWKSDKSWEPEKIWKFGNLEIWKFKNLNSKFKI